MFHSNSMSNCLKLTQSKTRTRKRQLTDTQSLGYPNSTQRQLPCLVHSLFGRCLSRASFGLFFLRRLWCGGELASLCTGCFARRFLFMGVFGKTVFWHLQQGRTRWETQPESNGTNQTLMSMYDSKKGTKSHVHVHAWQTCLSLTKMHSPSVQFDYFVILAQQARHFIMRPNSRIVTSWTSYLPSQTWTHSHGHFVL